MKLHVLAPLFFQKLIWIPTRLILVIFGRVTIRGLDNLRGIETPVIFACNHSSEIDPFMVPATLPFFSRFSPLFYAVREKSFYDDKGWRQQIFNEWFIKLWGGYPATVGLKDYEKSLLPHIELFREGNSFCMFPEGRITRDGSIQEAKGGVSFLAHTRSCVIVPVGISNVFGMSVKDFFSFKRRIAVSYGAPIRPEDLYTAITQPHEQGKSVWKEEADYILKKVGELIHSPSSNTV